MQEKTSVGGLQSYRLCYGHGGLSLFENFPFTFKEGELADYYKDWELAMTMKILAIFTVAMRMATVFNYALRPCLAKKIK